MPCPSHPTPLHPIPPYPIPSHHTTLGQRAPKLLELALPLRRNPPEMPPTCHFHPGVTHGVSEGPPGMDHCPSSP